MSSSGIVAGTPRDQASDEGAERNFVALACLPPPRNRTRAIVFCWMPLDQRRGRGRAVPCGMRGAGNPSPAAARLPEPLRSGDHAHGVHAPDHLPALRWPGQPGVSRREDQQWFKPSG